MTPADLIQNPAERVLTVCCADRPIEPERPVLHPLQAPIVREGPASSPQLPCEGMGVFQADTAIRCLADMANDVQALDRVRPHQFSNFGLAAGQRVVESTTTPAFVEGNTPAVAVRACPPTALNEPRETKPDVRRDVAVHAQQLAHGRNFSRAAVEGKRAGPHHMSVTETSGQ